MAHLSFEHRVPTGAHMGIAEMPTPSQRPCRDESGSKHSGWCKPADCHADCSVRSHQPKQFRRMWSQPSEAEPVDDDLAALAENGKATRRQRGADRAKRAGASSQYRGVSHDRGGSGTHWRSLIWVEGMRIDLGYFNSDREAAEAYNAAVIEHKLPAYRLNVIAEEEK